MEAAMRRMRLSHVTGVWKSVHGIRIAGLRSVAFVVCAFVTFSLLATAQSTSSFDTGTIAGTVTDQSGAMIPQAAVVITNVGTAREIRVQTGGDGSFSVPGLPFGNYIVTATARQFGKTTTKPFGLTVGATARVDLTLSVVAATENVEVSGTNTTVDTTTATSGTVLNSTQISNLPTNGRDAMDFLEIAPGSVNSIGFFQGSVNGQENFFTGLDVTLDGQSASRGDINGFDETEGNEAARRLYT